MTRGLARLPGLSLLTPLGATVLAVSAAAWVLGAVVGWIELFLAAGTGLLVVAACALFTLNRAQPTVELNPQRRRFSAGGSTTVEVRVLNTFATPLRPVDLEVVVGDAAQLFSAPTIRGNGHWADSFLVVGARRGVIPVGPATTFRGDPLGLLERRVSWAEVRHIYVHPVITPLPPLGGGLLRDLEGRATSELSMTDLAFHTLREYAPGDDRRYIHWRSSAKALTAGGKLMVRQFQDTRRTQLLVVMDGERANYADEEEFELAISCGASVAVQAVHEDLDVTVVAADQLVARHGSRKTTAQAVLDACSRATFTRRPIAASIGEGVKHAGDVTLALIVTGSVPDFLSLRRAASRVPRHISSAVVRVAPGENPALAAGVPVSVLTMGQLTDLRGLLRKREEV